MNPSVNRPVILAAGMPQILLPWDNAEVFQANLESYGGGRLASWTVWVAPTTMHPAEAAKRVGMSEAEFRGVNAIPPRVVIRAGSSLLIPRLAHTASDVAGQVADNGQLSLAPEQVLRKTVVKAGKGETVSSIARRYRVSASQVAQWNKVSAAAAFKPGQSITLFFPPSATPKPAVTAARKAPSATTTARKSTTSKGRTKAKQ